MSTRSRAKAAKAATSQAITKSTPKPAPKKKTVPGTHAKPTEESPKVDASSRKRKQKEPIKKPADITADSATLAQFQAWRAQQKGSDAAREKVAKAAKDKSIQELNAKLLAEQENQEDTDVADDTSEEEAQPKKKTRLDVVLDDDEVAALKDLTWPDEEDETGLTTENDEEEDIAGLFEEEVINLASGKKIPPKEHSEEPEDEDEKEDVFGNNGISIVNTNAKSPSSSRALKASSPALSGKGSKVTRGDFESSDVLALADTAKSMVRMRILFGNWDTTHSGKSGSQRWAADILQAVVEEELTMKKALRHAFKDDARKENLLTYILYGKGALLNTFIGKARLLVATSYGLTGRKEDVRVRVAWLLKKTQFTYGGLDADNQTVEKTKIWGNPMIKELLQVVLFGQGAKADARSVQEVRKNQAIPISAIILSITAIEHAIGEYRDGSCRQYPFKERGIRKRYTYHEMNWNTLQKLSEKWATFYLRGVFEAIATAVGLDDLVGTQNSGEDVEGITAMDLDNIVEMGVNPF